jgi:multidrug efflux pump subunit AcrA (membrane-fusion protein)
VKEILLKPGARVTEDSVIGRLVNPELVQQVESAAQELAQSKANLRQLKLNNQREKLHESAILSEIKFKYDSVVLKRKAEHTLAKKGIISELNFQQTELDERQLLNQVRILKQRIKQLDLVHIETINIQLERIKQRQGKLDIAQSRLDSLEVKAGFDGVLQRLDIELGQSLSAGQEVGLIGSITDLIAMIKVPQSQAQQLKLGQEVVIDMRQDKIVGLVARIDPVVENNSVNVEVSLPEILPNSARPQLNVDGKVIIKNIPQALYISRPAKVSANSEYELYHFTPTSGTAERKSITFGHRAGRYIEIISGAEFDQQYIISDLSNLEGSIRTLSIN